MRYVLPLILSFALLSTGPVRAQITSEVSDVTGAKRLVSKSMRTLVTESYPGHGSFRAEYENPPEKDSVWRLAFFGFAEDTTEMSAASTVRMQVDGQTITPIEVTSRVRQLESSVLEIKEAAFSRSDFKKIATANNVVATIGPARFAFTRPIRKDLRLILERVPKGKGPQTASSDDSGSNQ